MTDIVTQLATHEAVIERGLTTFLDVGTALAAIRDGRLYRETHERFEDYCRERWDISRQRAQQLVTAADVVTTIVDSGLPAPSNEGQTRELGRVPEEHRHDVWLETTTRGTPTAALVREVAAEIAARNMTVHSFDDVDRMRTESERPVILHWPTSARFDGHDVTDTTAETGRQDLMLEARHALRRLARAVDVADGALNTWDDRRIAALLRHANLATSAIEHPTGKNDEPPARLLPTPLAHDDRGKTSQFGAPTLLGAVQNLGRDSATSP